MKNYFNLNILVQAISSLKFLDPSSKRILINLVWQFLLGSLFESFALTLIYKLLNTLFNNPNNDDVVFQFNDSSFFKEIDISLFIFFTILVILFSGAIRTIILKKIYNKGAIISHKLSLKQIEIFNKLDYSIAREIEPSKWLTHNQFIFTYTSAIIQPLLQIMASTFLGLTIFFTILFLYKFYLLSILFVTFLIYYFIVLLFNKKLIESSNLIRNFTPESYFYQNTFLEALQEIRVYKWADNILNSFKNADRIIKFSNASRVIISNSPRIIVETFILIIVLIISLYAVAKGNISELAITLLGIQKLLPNIQQVYNSLSTMKANLHVIEAIKNPSIFKEKENNDFSNIHKIEVKAKIINKKNIDVNSETSIKALNLETKVHKSYLKYPNKILFPRNNWISITGKTGCGKTTLIEMIIGLLEPYKGIINISDFGNMDKNNNIIKWQSSLAYMPQFGFLVNKNIIDNIVFPNKEFDKKKLFELMNILEIDEEHGFTSIQNGLIGNNGRNLSGGQRQKVRLARAFYLNKEYIFLDEPSNGLDPKTEQRIFKKLKEKYFNNTVIYITHSNFMKNISDFSINLTNSLEK